MDAHKLWMLRDFIGTNKVLFRIPVYPGMPGQACQVLEKPLEKICFLIAMRNTTCYNLNNV